jgi:transcriptional regulator with XRE-family HTH domain
MQSGLTQEKLAEKADITLRYIQLLEAGTRNPSIQTIVSLQKALRCSFDEFFKGL